MTDATLRRVSSGRLPPDLPFSALSETAPARFLWLRLAVGLVQGMALYGLYLAGEQKSWPATNGFIYAPLVTASIFVPYILTSSLGHLRPFTSIAWVAIAVTLCAGLALHNVDANVGGDLAQAGTGAGAWPVLFAILFILHALAVAGDRDRRFIARYPVLFETAWKHGLQVALAAIFTTVLWAILFLGDALFRLIRIEAWHNLITEAWFWIPVTALAVAAALHFTDVQSSVIEGTRTLVLRLLGWLLPVLTGLAAVFAVALPFTSDSAFWATERALYLPLETALVLIFLLNTVYQDGASQRQAPLILRTAILMAVAVLVPVTVYAGYALWGQVRAGGWLPDRVFAAAGLVLVACYTLGYGTAVLRSGHILKGVGPTNVITAFVSVALGIALHTPLLDPARITIWSQVRRLDAGLTAPDKFDYKLLRFETGRYGRAALSGLVARTGSSQAEAISARARQALALEHRWGVVKEITAPATSGSRAKNITVLFPVTPGATLPESFLSQMWSEENGARGLGCLLHENETCNAVLADLTQDGKPEILILDKLPSGGTFGSTGAVFTLEDGQVWRKAGALQQVCARRPARQGSSPEKADKPFQDFQIVPSPFSQVVIENRRYFVSEECL